MKSQAVRLNYKEYGQGLPLILHHGFPFNNSIWEDVAYLLSGSAHIICPDLRGHGISPAPGGIYTMESMAADIAILMDNLFIDEAILVGHSLGGYISLAFIAEFPQRCIGLGLVTSLASADSPEKKPSRYQTLVVLEENCTNSIIANIPDSLTNFPEVEQKVREMICMTPMAGLVGTLRGMAERPDWMKLLSSITIPTLIVAGENDKIVPLEAARSMAQKMRTCKLEIIQGAGHMPMLETPQTFSRMLRYLMDRVQNDMSYPKGVT